MVHVTAEYWPFARSGGLAEAVRGLARHQVMAGHAVTVILPLYRSARAVGAALEPEGAPFRVALGPVEEPVRLWRLAESDGPRVLFLEHDGMYDRAGLYGERGADYPDNARRFACLCRAAVAALPQLVGARAVLHAHDWHAALAPVYARVLHEHDPWYEQLACVLSVHNAGFQGHFDRADLAALGLPERLWSVDGMEWYGRLNLLKGALLHSDIVTTVSPTHAHELRTEAGGFGLHDTFISLRNRLIGILNGIDQANWDPARDPHIISRFTVDDLSGKDACKRDLQRRWQLPENPDVAVFGMTARLAAQKGIDLILGGDSLRSAPAQFVFLGEGESRYREALDGVARGMPDRVAVNFAFSDPPEHRLLAGADFLMMPSLYEPCGLTQMRAQRYGALPVARRVGGLGDTIEDEITGFLFDDYTPVAFDTAVRRALALFADRPTRIEHARLAMQRDFGWPQAVDLYAAAYKRAQARRA